MKHRAKSALASFALVLVVMLSALGALQATMFASSHTNTQLWGQLEVNNGGVTMWLKICGTGAHYRFRSARVSNGQVLWDQAYGAVNGCTPQYRAVVGAKQGEQIRFYSMVYDPASFSEADFLQRAHRHICTVTNYNAGTISCSQETATAPFADINEPSDGQTFSGPVTLRGWAVDAACLSGTCISDIHVYANDTWIGAASYGESRPDVTSLFSDSRFNNAGYRLDFSVAGLPNGTYALKVFARSTLSGQWQLQQRSINVDHNIPPNAPQLTAPADNATLNTRAVGLSWNDTGDEDNWPRPYRDFYVEVWKADNSWSNFRGWDVATNWTVNVPSDGQYRWRVRSSDGRDGNWSAERSFIVTSINIPPNAPNLVSPSDGATLTVSAVTLIWQDAGDPDNGPRPSREFYVEVRKSDNSWNANHTWNAATSWTANVPGNGSYVWRVKSNDNLDDSAWSTEHGFTVNIPVVDSPPNPPNLVEPANGSTQTSRTFSLLWSDAGDPDNGPRNYRDFEADIWKADNSWRSHYNWQTGSNWTVTVPNDGTYVWQVRSGDGQDASTWSTRTLVVNAAGNAQHDDTRIRGAAEYSGTTIFAKICGRGTNYRLRSERLNPSPGLLGDWSYGAINGCTGEYRPVINAVAGEQFRIYTTVSNGALSLTDFLARARRHSCTVMAVGTVVCNLGDTPPSYNQPPVTGDPMLLTVRYVDQVYVQQTLQCFIEEGVRKCYWNNCGPASVAMLLNYEGKEPRDVSSNRQATLDLVPLVKPPGWGASRWDLIQNTVRNKGLQIASGAGMSEAAIRTSIAQGHPIAMGFGIGHIIIITGIAPNGKFVVNDPMGGYKWWTVPWSPTANRNDAPWTPPFATSRIKGFKTEYSYQELVGMGLGNYVRVIGPRPTVSSTLHTGGSGILQKSDELLVLTGDGVELVLPQTVTTLSITHTSLIMPTQIVSNTSSILAAFTLAAADSTGTAVSAYAAPFSMTIELDAGVVDSLGDTQGETLAPDQSPSDLGSTLAATRPVVVLKQWNATTSSWQRVQTTVDLNSYRIIAQTEQFGEYAVFIEQQNAVFLPFVIR